MGVMVSCADIIATAKREKVDIVGLSGLITPSLDEMVFVAKEMKKAGLNVSACSTAMRCSVSLLTPSSLPPSLPQIPLLIGGATTSRMHAAVKIAPQYSTREHPVLHVLDASRSVVVVQNLLDENAKEEYVDDVMDLYEEMREEHYASLEDRKCISLSRAIERRCVIDWNATPPAPAPAKLGVTTYDSISLQDLVQFIDWSPFFLTWELRGRYPNRGYPKIFKDTRVGEEARRVFDDAQAMLKEIIENQLLVARGIVGLFRANSVGEDVEIYGEDGSVAATLCMLRQQMKKETDDPYLSQADFVAPKVRPTALCRRDREGLARDPRPRSQETNKQDHVGMMAVGVFGVSDLVTRFEKENDDYKKIMAQALGDRLAEAAAEWLHHRVRVDLWGYAPEESLDQQDLFRIKYEGIRPAPGYPSQPDHTEKRTMWNLCQVEEKTGIELTDSLAMNPASAVSALIFAHPKSEYFAVGHIEKDQVESYAQRKKQTVEETERWLAPNLNYDVPTD